MVVRSLLAPWPGKAGRSLTVLGRTAAQEYATVVAAVATAVESGLGTDVHGGRVARLHPLEIEPWGTALRRHRAAAAAAAAEARAALRTDVADCYRSIRADHVRAALADAGADPVDISRVIAFLRRTSAAGIPGLPVGPDPSAVLANAVLGRLDAAATAGPTRCLRWYDDLLVLAPSVSAAIEAEAAIAEAARQIELRLHPGKRRLAVGPSAVRRLALGAGVASRTVLTAGERPH